MNDWRTDNLTSWLDDWLSRTLKRKLFGETSFKNAIWQLTNIVFQRGFFKNAVWRFKNKVFLHDVLQKWNLQTHKGSSFARLPSKMYIENSKTKLFYPFKNEICKLKNEAFLQDVLQKNASWKVKKNSFSYTSFRTNMLNPHLVFSWGIQSPVNAVHPEHKSRSTYAFYTIYSVRARYMLYILSIHSIGTSHLLYAYPIHNLCTLYIHSTPSPPRHTRLKYHKNAVVLDAYARHDEPLGR